MLDCNSIIMHLIALHCFTCCATF